MQVVVGACRRTSSAREAVLHEILDLLKRDAVAEYLEEARRASGERDIAVGVDLRHVARPPDPFPFVALHEVLRAHGVPHSDNRTLVDEFAVLDAEPAAVLGLPYRADQVKMHIRPNRRHHPRRLGLPISLEEGNSASLRKFRILATQGRRKSAARDEQCAKRREIPIEEAEPVKRLVHVGNAGDMRRTRVAHDIRKLGVHHRLARHDERTARLEN